MHIPRYIPLIAILMANALVPLTVCSDSLEDKVRVTGTSLTIVLDGRHRTGPDLIGFTLTVANDQGIAVDIRIDGAVKASSGSDIDWLYDLRAQDVTGNWVPYCAAAADGDRLGFPIAGWTDPSGSFRPSDQAKTFSCSGGAIAKCIHMGYAPWRSDTVDTSRLNQFRACTRMIRADYCGNGETYTNDGTPVNVYDRRSLQRAGSAPGMSFEAAWGPDGAVCVAKTRWSNLFTLDHLHVACGEKLATRIGPRCVSSIAHELPGALIFNESP